MLYNGIYTHMCIYNIYNAHTFYVSVNSRVYANGPYIHRVCRTEAFVNTCVHVHTLWVYASLECMRKLTHTWRIHSKWVYTHWVYTYTLCVCIYMHFECMRHLIVCGYWHTNDAYTQSQCIPTLWVYASSAYLHFECVCTPRVCTYTLCVCIMCIYIHLKRMRYSDVCAEIDTQVTHTLKVSVYLHFECIHRVYTYKLSVCVPCIYIHFDCMCHLIVCGNWHKNDAYTQSECIPTL